MSVWACVAAYCGSDEVATTVLRVIDDAESDLDAVQRLAQAFDRCDVEVSQREAVLVFAPEADGGDLTGTLVAQLDPAARRAVIARYGLAVEGTALSTATGLEPDHVAAGLVRAERRLGNTTDEVARRLAPLLERPAPSDDRRRRPAVLVGSVVALLAVVLLVVALTGPKPSAPTAAPTGSRADEPVLSPTTAPTTVVPVVTSPPTTRRPLNPDDYREPDRELEILLTDNDTVVRLEPWTRRLIWESRPFTEPDLVSIDPNTVTITSGGYRVILDLNDGTQLPP